jgi:FMNH2-dependent dimethyl sulfone monooxygenase
MKFGVWTPLPHTIRPEDAMDRAVADLRSGSPLEGPDAAFEIARDTIVRAEQCGFEITLIAQRYLGPDIEAWTLATALAMATSRIELMVAVHPGMLSPQIVAKMGASLDRLSQGRAAINVVNGWWEEEFNLFSNGGWVGEPGPRYARMRDYIETMKGLWGDGEFRHEGAFFKADVPASIVGSRGKVTPPEAGEIIARCRRGPGLPLYAASRSGPGKQIIAETCDVWFAEYAPGFRNFEDNLASVARQAREMDEICARSGRRLGYALNPQVIIADTMEEAERLADIAEHPDTRDRVSNALGAGFVGTPQVVAERIARYEEIGVSCLMLRFSPMLEGIERFGAEVIPLLRR